MGRYNMKRDFATIVVGLLFLGAGVIIGGVLLGFFDFDISLAGWWTIFIIAPALFSMAQSGVNAGNMIMLAVGMILLMNAQEIFPVYISWRLIFPIVLIAVGVQLLFGKSITCKSCGTGTDGKEQVTGDANRHQYTAFFAGQDVNFGNEVFTGASYTATFGAVTADLRNVTLNGDAVILVSALFGGIDIFLPKNVKLVSHVVPVLGGMESKFVSSQDPAAHTIIIRGTATFGGVSVQ